MIRLSAALAGIAAALLVVGCNGGGGTTPATTDNSVSTSAHLVDSGIANPRFLRLMRTPPFPPPRRHKITTEMRIRAATGGWQHVSSVPPFQNGPETELLLTDGTVVVQDYCTPDWWKLTPDSSGNYATGTWSELASMPSGYSPLYFASAVLPNGYMIMNGGEYNGPSCSNVETNLGAIYDPFNNTWAAVSAPSGWARIGDGQSVVLSNGTYMLGNCCYVYQALYNQEYGTWTQTGPDNGKQDVNSEEGWTLLPSGNVLVVNVSDPPYAQYYDPSTNEWDSAGELPVNIITGFEIGPQTLMPNGTVFVAGATGANVLYSKKGKWTQTASFPTEDGKQLDVADGPSALLTDGDVMIPASPGLYNAPTYYFTFNGSTLTLITAPPNAVNDSTYNTRLLLLPNGQILETDGSEDIEIYTASGSGSSGHPPTITSVPTTLTAGDTYTVSGKRLNGMSQANMYGDDDQQATNFPLVRITNTASGNVVYCRTHGFSAMPVASSAVVSASFDVPSTIQSGASTLVVVANGISSKSVSVTIEPSAHHH